MILPSILLIAGVLLMLIAAIGLIRLTDPLQRMHSATKAGTLGTALVIAGVLMASDAARTSTGILTLLFLLFTLPVTAQLLGRATYLSDAALKGIDKQEAEGLEALDRLAETGGNAKGR